MCETDRIGYSTISNKVIIATELYIKKSLIAFRIFSPVYMKWTDMLHAAHLENTHFYKESEGEAVAHDAM
jgi:hypothetical protein